MYVGQNSTIRSTKSIILINVTASVAESILRLRGPGHNRKDSELQVDWTKIDVACSQQDLLRVVIVLLLARVA